MSENLETHTFTGRELIDAIAAVGKRITERGQAEARDPEGFEFAAACGLAAVCKAISGKPFVHSLCDEDDATIREVADWLREELLR